MTDPVLLRFRYDDLRQLSWHWSDAYVITWEAGQFCARRRDNGATVRCTSADELYREIQRDYSARPVPRRMSSRKAGNRLGSA